MELLRINSCSDFQSVKIIVFVLTSFPFTIKVYKYMPGCNSEPLITILELPFVVISYAFF
jgi:hypothetical protein